MYGKLEAHQRRHSAADKHYALHTTTFAEKQQTGPAMELRRPKGPKPSPLEKPQRK